MSDQYAPQEMPIYRSSAAPYSIPVLAELPIPTLTRSSGSGLGTGLMVCGVFVVVAVLAAVFYSPGYVSAPTVNSPANSVVQSNGAATPEATPAIDPTVVPAAPANP